MVRDSPEGPALARDTALPSSFSCSSYARFPPRFSRVALTSPFDTRDCSTRKNEESSLPGVRSRSTRTFSACVLRKTTKREKESAGFLSFFSINRVNRIVRRSSCYNRVQRSFDDLNFVFFSPLDSATPRQKRVYALTMEQGQRYVAKARCLPFCLLAGDCWLSGTREFT